MSRITWILVGVIAAACGRVDYDPLAMDIPDSAPDTPDSAPAACELPSGLVVHLPFDEMTGDRATDASGNGQNGVLVGLDETDWVAGQLGNALDLRGTEGYVDTGSNDRVDNVSPMTVCAWIYPTSYPDQYPAIADKSEDTFTGGWNFYIETGGLLGFLTNRRKWATGGTIALNTWQHACAAWDGSGGTGGIALYIDGAAIQVGDTGSNGNATDSDAARDLLIGRVNNATYEFDGLIDDFQLYDRSLEQSGIATIYDCGAR